nr:integrase, catalytic region, zinc finger, CCHC-type, peptidase aspartic, catalytic [Tanacetum cinerariifolium]
CNKEKRALTEDQPLPNDVSPTAISPGYIAGSDPKEDEEDPEEDPADYPADGGDDDDNESSDDDNDDDDVIVDSGCSKHITGDRSLLKIYVKKFTGTVRFGNDHFAKITGYGDYVQGNITVCHVYYVEGLGHNLFSVGQFCDGDLEVAFGSKTCYMQNIEGDDLLTEDRESNLYTISIVDMAASSSVSLMSKATSTKS